MKDTKQPSVEKNNNLKLSQLVIIIIAFGGIVGITILLNNKNSNTKVLGIEKSINSSYSTYATQTDSKAEVVVEVTPKEINKDQGNNIFEVKLNTHSVELDYDFKERIKLTDENGNTYDALEWTGNSGWHHVSGDIVFPNVSSDANELKLTIRKVNELDREFKWQIK